LKALFKAACPNFTARSNIVESHSDWHSAALKRVDSGSGRDGKHKHAEEPP
jgi:hypothetical protein